MRLSDFEFKDWCRKNQIFDEAILMIERIRNSEPSRRVGGGPNSVSGTFPSRKMGNTIQFESRTNELAFIYQLEHDKKVLEFYDQPPKIKLSYYGKDGKKKGPWHTPDFFVIYEDYASWVECKTENQLLKLAVNEPNRFQLTSEGRWICPPGEEFASPYGLSYRLQSSREINWTFQRNIMFLEDYYRRDSTTVNKISRKTIIDAVRREPAITLQQLLDKTGGESTLDDILLLIVSEVIYFDIEAAFLGDHSEVHIFTDKATASAYKNISTLHQSEGTESHKNTKCVTLTPNTAIVWDGKPWKIINVGNNKVTLINDLDVIAEPSKTVFERLVINGSIENVSLLEQTFLSGDVCRVIMEAKPEALETANYRLPFVLKWVSSGEVSIDLPVDKRTLRRWVARYRQAEQVWGNGYLGLLPSVNNGNRKSKIDPASKALMEKWISEEFENIKQKSSLIVYKSYLADCKKLGLVAVSLKTFCLNIKKRDIYEQTLKRKGKRAAQKHQSFYWELELTTPKHGDRPFHICHIDHTKLDIELVDSKTSRNLGRPWLTILIDAYSRRILAIYLTFDPPSYRSNLMVLRECVRQHGRLPQILVVDGGKDFASIYFDTFLAYYEIAKQTRPPAKPNFGSVIERLFGTANTQFVYNLLGNTQITKNVRQITKSVNPKNHAVWNLKSLFERFSSWAYEIYDQTEHSSLNQTPREIFAAGMLIGGERVHRLIPYNADFKIMTLPTVPKGTAKVSGNRGVKIRNIHYWTDEFRHPEVVGKQVRVRYDPFDAGKAYAFVNGSWRECISEHYKTFRNRSEREVKIATDELRQRKKLHGKNTETSSGSVARFIESMEADKVLLKQRAMDRELRPVLNIINGNQTTSHSLAARFAEGVERNELFNLDEYSTALDFIDNEIQEDLDCEDDYEIYETIQL